MNGRRVYPDAEGRIAFAPGDYGKEDGRWYARPPTNPEKHLTGYLDNHQVTEHEDGTITVSPSILITGHERGARVQWHGFLERGIWREV